MTVKFRFFTLVFKWVEIEEGFCNLVIKENTVCRENFYMI
jgi:hypothetical protein